MASHKRAACAAILSVAIAACGAAASEPSTRVGEQSSALRSLSNAEALADFDEMVTSFRSLYGALTRKEARYGFDFETMASDYRNRIAQATTEPEYTALGLEFISRFEDAHISLQGTLESDDSHDFQLPFIVMPIENTYVISGIAPSLGSPGPLTLGDELLSIDGVTTDDLIQQYLKYAGVPSPLTAKIVAASYLTDRPSYVAGDLVDGAPVTLHLRDGSGAERDLALAWQDVPNPTYTADAVPAVGSSTRGTTVEISAYEQRLERREQTVADQSSASNAPFFYTSPVLSKFAFSEVVRPSVKALEKFGVDPTVAANIQYFAVTYTYCGAKLLLLRLPDYQPADRLSALNYLRALLDEQSKLVDGLVFDETRNPGGSVDFGLAIVSLLSSRTVNGLVQETHADRLSIGEYAGYAQALLQQGDAADAQDARRYQDYAHQIDTAYSAGQPLAAPLPLPGTDTTIDADGSHWSKPFIVLTDERSGSEADFVPLLIQANKLAGVFGQRTVGAGGNVEQVATLTNTQYQLRLSRGLGTVFDPTGAYPAQRFIEDLGVTPDIPYSHTLADYRAGYVAYVDAFSHALFNAIQH